MTRIEAFDAALRANDATALRTLLADLPEDERVELLPIVRPYVTEVSRRGLDGLSRLRAMLFVAYGILPVSDIRKLGWRSNHLPDGVEDVLRRRSLERLVPIVDHLLDQVGRRAWSPVRALVREGVVPRPDRPSYTIAMLAATQYREPAEVVAADPGLLDVEVWRLFEVEGGGEDSLAAHEKYTGDKWGDFFRDLAARDSSTRARLLDASLAALARDFATFRAGWSSRFHESLEPTDDERATRAEAYLGLLRSRSGPTVSFAVRALTRVSRAGRLAPGALLARIEPVLGEGPAGTSKAALELVKRAGKDPEIARKAAIVAAGALNHPSADVQHAAIKIVETLVREPDDAVAQAVAEHMNGVAASQRAAAEGLVTRLGSKPVQKPPRESPAPPGSTASLATAPMPASEAPPSSLDPARAIAPLPSDEALVDLAVSVVETGEPADDVERLLETVGRLAPERPHDLARLTKALAKRARTILARRESTPFDGFDARADVAAVLLAWTSGETVAASPARGSVDPGAGAFLSARALEVAQAVARGDAFRSVAAPTHRGGFIDPVVLVERLSSRPPASPLDLVAALLRLATERRAEALAAAGDLPGEVGAVTRYALGGDDAIGPTAAWWVAAARTRAPGEDDARVEKRHPRLGPDAGLAARVSFVERSIRFRVETLTLESEPQPSGPVGIDLPTVLMHRLSSSFSWTGQSDPAMLRWMATVQPAYREAWAAVGCAPLARNVDWWSAEWANRAFLEPFVDPVTEIGTHARRLIGIALGAREAGERGLSTDIARLALADGRMSDAQLAEGLAGAAAIGCDRPNRWALSLAEVASTSEAHARSVGGAILAALPSLVDRPPAKLVPLLRLLDEVLADTSAGLSEEGGTSLASLSGSGGQAGRLARSILARGGVSRA